MEEKRRERETGGEIVRVTLAALGSTKTKIRGGLFFQFSLKTQKQTHQMRQPSLKIGWTKAVL